MPNSLANALQSVLFSGLIASSASAQFQTHLDPLATYLLHPATPVATPLVLPLSTVGVHPGDCIHFAISGTFQCNMPWNPSCVSSSAAVVFSSTSTVLGPGERYRIPGAIAAGPTSTTNPNCSPNGSSPTDIPEDFRISAGIDVRVPAGAAFLIVGSPDCWNSDNLDTDGDFRLTVTVIGCPADFNCSGTVTVQDVFDFLGAYFTTSAQADFNGSGSVGIQDIFDFLAAYFAGCA